MHTHARGWRTILLRPLQTMYRYWYAANAWIAGVRPWQYKHHNALNAFYVVLWNVTHGIWALLWFIVIVDVFWDAYLLRQPVVTYVDKLLIGFYAAAAVAYTAFHRWYKERCGIAPESTRRGEWFFPLWFLYIIVPFHVLWYLGRLPIDHIALIQGWGCTMVAATTLGLHQLQKLAAWLAERATEDDPC